MDITGGKIYTGPPKKIVMEIAAELGEVLQNAGIHPTGVHVVALLHLAVSMVRAGNDKSTPVDLSMGKMPSFKSLLSVLTHGVMNTSWSREELQSFDEEFCKIVESLGGEKLRPGESLAPTGPLFMAPMSKEVH